MYLQSLPSDKIPKQFVVAKDSHALQCIMMKVNFLNSIECIVDSGCQIIAMSEAVCYHHVHSSYHMTLWWFLNHTSIFRLIIRHFTRITITIIFTSQLALSWRNYWPPSHEISSQYQRYHLWNIPQKQPWPESQKLLCDSKTSTYFIYDPKKKPYKSITINCTYFYTNFMTRTEEWAIHHFSGVMAASSRCGIGVRYSKRVYRDRIHPFSGVGTQYIYRKNLF